MFFATCVNAGGSFFDFELRFILYTGIKYRSKTRRLTFCPSCLFSRNPKVYAFNSCILSVLSWSLSGSEQFALRYADGPQLYITEQVSFRLFIALMIDLPLGSKCGATFLLYCLSEPRRNQERNHPPFSYFTCESSPFISALMCLC